MRELVAVVETALSITLVCTAHKAASQVWSGQTGLLEWIVGFV